MELSLEEMKNIDIRNVDPNTITDLRDIKIPVGVSVKEKLNILLASSNNLYVHKVGNICIKLSFSNNGKTIEDVITTAVMTMGT